jgi:hypothetical protein
MEGDMRVRVINRFSFNYDRTGIADVAAWDRGDFWIPVTIGSQLHTIAKRDLEEA